MNPAFVGLAWACLYVLLESTQFVYFGGLFQRMSAFWFGFLVYGITTVAFVGLAAYKTPWQLKLAFANPIPLISANIAAVLAVASYLGSVQLIEPAVTYTISAGAMPITAYLAYRFGVPEGDPMRNRVEGLGNIFLFAGVVYMLIVTVGGWSGFVRGDTSVAVTGVVLAIIDGALFTWVIIYCQRLNVAGVGPSAVFGLRFPLYVVFAGSAAALGFDEKSAIPLPEVAIIVVVGLILTIPPLYALQKAVASVSTMTISALTALGPFVIFGLQIVEGRVDYSTPVLIGLVIYVLGAMLAAAGAVRAAIRE